MEGVEAAVKLSHLRVGERGRLGGRSDAVPNGLDKPDALGDGQLHPWLNSAYRVGILEPAELPCVPVDLKGFPDAHDSEEDRDR